jgi:hypothetical protein
MSERPTRRRQRCLKRGTLFSGEHCVLSNPMAFVDPDGRLIVLGNVGSTTQNAINNLRATKCGSRIYDALNASPIHFNISDGGLDQTGGSVGYTGAPAISPNFGGAVWQMTGMGDYSTEVPILFNWSDEARTSVGQTPLGKFLGLDPSDASYVGHEFEHALGLTQNAEANDEKAAKEFQQCCDNPSCCDK